MINEYSILNGIKYFIEDGSQNYLILEPLVKNFDSSKTAVEAKVVTWKSKGLWNESIILPVTSDNSPIFPNSLIF